MSAIRTAAATLALVGAIAGPAAAQTTATPENTVAIDACHVHKSDHMKFTYAYCAIVSDIAAGESASVQWKVNLPTFTPKSPGGTWSKGSGTTKLAGQTILNVKFAFKNKTVAQVTKSLKVTLSNPKNVTITRGTATAASS